MTHTENFISKWDNSIIEDMCGVCSPSYKAYHKALMAEIGKIASDINGNLVKRNCGHYFSSCFIKHNGKYVYINYEPLMRTKVCLTSGTSFLIRSAKDENDYTGGSNNFCSLSEISNYVEELTK